MGDVCSCALAVFCAVARTGLVLADTKLGQDERAAEGEPEGAAVKLLQHTFKRHPKHEKVAEWGLLLLYLLLRTEMDLPADDETCAEQILRSQDSRDRWSNLATTATEFGRQTEPEWSDEVQMIGRAVQYALKPAHQRERRDTYWK